MMISKLFARFRKPKELPRDPIEEKLEALEVKRAHLREGGRHRFNPARRELHPIAEEEIRNGTDEIYRSNRDIGPWVNIKASCDSCTFYEYEWTRIHVTGQNDVDRRESRCKHESVGNRVIPHGSETPLWCPFVGSYVEQLAKLWQPTPMIPLVLGNHINGLPSTTIKVPMPPVQAPRGTYTAETHSPTTPPPAKA